MLCLSSLPEEVDGDVQVLFKDDGKAHVLIGQNGGLQRYRRLDTLYISEPWISISECINMLELRV